MSPNPEPRILVVDDEKAVRNLLSAMLRRRGYRVSAAGTSEVGLRLIERNDVDLVITDLRMPGMPGEAMVARLKQIRPALPVIVISGHGNTQAVVEVIKKGAVDYLAKPFLDADLDVAVTKALQQQRLLLENERLRREAGGPAGAELVGRSPAMRKAREALATIAKGGGPVLLLGDSGTGKELAARAIHLQSARSNGPFVGVNAGAVPAELFESEFFGTRRGAYTGAVADSLGLFRSAQGGTLFLDEVGEIAPQLQAKLLRVLETGEVRVVGETRARKVDVRVVSATNRDLKSMVEQGTFRRDLYYRLAVFPLRMPSLSQRREDIPLLADHLLALAAPGRPPRLSPPALKALMDYAWPGNVRELRNVLERATLFAVKGEIRISNLVFGADAGGLGAASTPLRVAKRRAAEAMEQQYVLDALRGSQGNVSRAARAAGMDRRNFQALMRKHGLR